MLDALRQYGEDKKLGMDGRPLHEARRRACVDATAQAYGLSAGEIGICSSSSEAYNLLALALSLVEGDEAARALALERSLFEKLLDSDDKKEGIAAFRDKRRPEFKGS